MKHRHNSRRFRNFLIGLAILVLVFLFGKYSDSILHFTQKTVPLHIAVEPAPPIASSTDVLILLNQDSATIQHMDGKNERMLLDVFFKKFAQLTLPAEGSKLSNGIVTPFPDPKLDKGAIPSPDWKYTARLAEPRADGATSIFLKPKTQNARTIILREGNQPLRDGSFAGWFDEKNMAIVAYTDQNKSLYSAGLDGSLKKIAPMPDTVVMSTMRHGIFWYVTATLGQGIETPPSSPSELHRVTLDGKEVRMAREEKQVITGIMAEANGRIAYSLDNGEAVLSGLGLPNGQLNIGSRHPVVLVSNGHVIIRDGFFLMAFDPATGATSKLSEIPEGEISVFVLH